MKVMLAHSFKDALVEFPCYMEPKLNGFRVLIKTTAPRAGFVDSSVAFYSRNGNEFTSLVNYRKTFAELVDRMRLRYGTPLPKTLWLDAEAVSGDFEQTSSEIRRKAPVTSPVEFHVFDVQIDEPYEVRSALVRSSVRDTRAKCLKMVPSVYVASMESLQAQYGKWVEKGLEGAMVKQCFHKYTDGRSRAWLKMKGRETLTCIVTGILPGTGKHAGRAGAFEAVLARGKSVEVRVGTGLSDALRKDAWENPGKYIGARIEVECQEKTKAGSLRHPRLVAVRVD